MVLSKEQQARLLAELTYATSSQAGGTSLAKNYVGMSFD